MLYAEKKCRKFYANHYEFSPTVKKWLDRCHAYRALIKLKLKMEELQTSNVRKLKDGNAANIYRAARRCDIADPKLLEKEELYVRYRECREKSKEMMASSPWMRKQFMSAKLAEAVDQNKEDDARRIKEVLRAEAHRKEWTGIHRVMEPERAGAISHVDVTQEDSTTKRMETKGGVRAGDRQRDRTSVRPSQQRASMPRSPVQAAWLRNQHRDSN